MNNKPFSKKALPKISETQLRNAIRWYLTMHTWEATEEQIEKTERMKTRLEDFMLKKVELVKKL